MGHSSGPSHTFRSDVIDPARAGLAPREAAPLNVITRVETDKDPANQRKHTSDNASLMLGSRRSYRLAGFQQQGICAIGGHESVDSGVFFRSPSRTIVASMEEFSCPEIRPQTLFLAVVRGGRCRLSGRRGKRREVHGNLRRKRHSATSLLCSTSRFPSAVSLVVRGHSAAGDRLVDHGDQGYGTFQSVRS